MLDAELQVFSVFLGQRWNAHERPREIDSFMLAELATVDDLALHVIAANRRNTQFDQAVRKQDASARLHFLRQRLEGCGDNRRSSGNITRRDDDALPGLQEHRRMLLQPS